MLEEGLPLEGRALKVASREGTDLMGGGGRSLIPIFSGLK